VAFEHGKLLTKRSIFQRDLFMTAEQEDEKPNRNDNCVEHEQATLTRSIERINI